MTAMEKFNLWIQEVPAGSAIAEELKGIAGNSTEIESRFGNDLTFGTAGLRGIMGAGTDRMNIYTVRRAALAYGQYIKEAPLPDSCAIAYDTRNNSRLFSEVCATALAEEGIHVYLYPAPAPTPMLSFAVRHLKTGGGVVMTASHNPAAYNGMKCYGNDGCQQTDEPAAEVFARMQKLPMISEPASSYDALVAEGKIELIGQEVYDSYYAAVLNESLSADQIPGSGLKVLYTPLHGTGLGPVTSLFKKLGVDYDLVDSQTTPDGNFPTCPYPNPETEPAFDEAIKVAAAPGAPDYDLILATDPDADRMAVAVPVKSADGTVTLRRFSGNEFGCLLLDYILDTRTKLGTLPENCKCVKSIVTTPMVRAVAGAYHCETVDVLTGFKYIGSTILGLEKQGREREIVFAFEESCGFLKGSYVRDKDAQVACMLASELAAVCKREKISLAEKMDRLYQKYGYYKNQVVSIDLDGEAGKKLCADFINDLRVNPLKELAGMKVEKIADYLNGSELDCASGATRKLDFPSSNVLSYQMGNAGQAILRPSGTEPKLKVYFFAADADEAQAAANLEAIVSDIRMKMKNFGVIQ